MEGILIILRYVTKNVSLPKGPHIHGTRVVKFYLTTSDKEDLTGRICFAKDHRDHPSFVCLSIDKPFVTRYSAKVFYTSNIKVISKVKGKT